MIIKKEFTKSVIEEKFNGKKTRNEVGKIGVECLDGYNSKTYYNCGYQFDTVADAIAFVKNALNTSFVRIFVYESIKDNTVKYNYIYVGSVKGV